MKISNILGLEQMNFLITFFKLGEISEHESEKVHHPDNFSLSWWWHHLEILTTFCSDTVRSCQTRDEKFVCFEDDSWFRRVHDTVADTNIHCLYQQGFCAGDQCDFYGIVIVQCLLGFS